MSGLGLGYNNVRPPIPISDILVGKAEHTSSGGPVGVRVAKRTIRVGEGEVKLIPGKSVSNKPGCATPARRVV